jgi:hypothetical protein
MRTVIACFAVLAALSVQAQAAEYIRGDEVRVTTADGQTASPPIQHVMAVPGDRIQIDATGLSVNETPIQGLSAKLPLACGTWDTTVPSGHYFLVGEQIQGQSASRSCSLVPASRVRGAAQAER